MAGAGFGRPGAGLPFFSGEAAGGKASKGGSMLEQFGTNLTSKARDGKLDPVIGRGREISRNDGDLEPPHEEQPAHSGRPGCGQDRARRRPCAGDRRGQRAENLMDKNIWRSICPDLLPVRSTAASSRSA